jgi:hypothetical protein
VIECRASWCEDHGTIFSKVNIPDSGIGLLRIFASARHRGMGYTLYFEKN